MNIQFSQLFGFSAFVEWMACATALLIVSCLLAIAFRRWSAAVRHRLWLLTFCGLLVLPAAMLFLPSLQIPLLPPVNPASVAEQEPANASSQWMETPAKEFVNDPAEAGIAADDFAQTVLPETSSGKSSVADNRAGTSVALSSHINDGFESASNSWYASIRFENWLLIIWILGFAVAVSPLLFGIVSTKLIQAGAERISDPRFMKLNDDIRSELKINRVVVLLRSSRSITPMTWGVWQPVIALPVNCREWSDERLRAVLTHELSHIRRGDVWAQAMSRITCGIYWFHPLVWFALRKMRIERELACDDCVISTGQKPSDYALQLVQIARSFKPGAINYGVAMATTSRLELRVASLFDFARSHMPLSRAASRWLLVGAMMAIIGLSTIRIGRQALDDTPLASTPAGFNAESVPNQSTKENVVNLDEIVEISGTISNSEGQPVEGASVSVMVREIHPHQAGVFEKRDRFLEGVRSSENGGFNVEVRKVERGRYQAAYVVAKKDGMAIAWQEIDLAAESAEVNLQLKPQQIILGKLVDLEGRPAAGVILYVGAVVETSPDIMKEPVIRYDGELYPETWFRPITSNADGSFEVHGVAPGYGVFVGVVDNDHFAPKSISLNTVRPETGGERDRTNLEKVKNVGPDEVATVALSPAQIFEGTVTYADTGKPVSFARVVIWASVHELGTRVAVAGQCDKDGKYKISPRPGSRFEVVAYAPPGDPYLAKTNNEIRWDAGDSKRTIDLELPRGVLVKGKVVDTIRNEAIPNAMIEYRPETASNEFARNDVETGWLNTQVTDAQGNFQITVFPGTGRIFVQSQGNYTQQMIDTSTIYTGRPGGDPLYPNAFVKINPEPESTEIDLDVIKLKPCKTVYGSFVDENGKPVTDVKVVSSLINAPAIMAFRVKTDPVSGSDFVLKGIEEEYKYSITALNPNRRMGATFTVTGNDEPMVTLKPFGQAAIRFVDTAGKPKKDFSSMIVYAVNQRIDIATGQPDDKEFEKAANGIKNLDLVNQRFYPKTDRNGRVVWQELIPGARYIVQVNVNRTSHDVLEFTAGSGPSQDLGTIRINEGSTEKPFEVIDD